MLGRLHYVFDRIFLDVEFEAAIGVETIDEFEHSGVFARLHEFLYIFFFNPFLHRSFCLDVLRELLDKVTGVGPEIQFDNLRSKDTRIFERIVKQCGADDRGIEMI